MRWALFFFLAVLAGCADVAPPPARTAPPKIRASAAPAVPPPVTCEEFIQWSDPSAPARLFPNQPERPTLTVIGLHVTSSDGALRITATTRESLDAFYNAITPDGKKYTDTLLDVFFNKTVNQEWGDPSAWAQATQKKGDDARLTIQMGWKFSREKIMGERFARYTMKTTNALGQWQNVPSPRGPAPPSFEDLTSVNLNTNAVTVNIPYALLGLSGGDALAIHYAQAHGTKPASSKCVRLGS